ncbi:PHB depolymerase family esterase [Brevundimonas sp. PAMC22021]|uniref:alpha/beta hydrolase family esterase n=1 Tax=Brevundimonas sp. PAMC22021 TaxID=2861285 RepID=UPI001C62F7CB|nr:PHB depolymerase family esterase [Brevundimonas sp. PAMC22021]QYF87616.1 prolyl oligopeptidase family serine peptidase [Brevundimonas sp. PAMC22021]
MPAALRLLPALLLLFLWSPAAARAVCDLAPAGSAQRVEIGRAGRPLLLHLPRSLDPAAPAPLVFVLHGSGGTGVDILRDSRLAETADRHGFIVAAPDAGIPVERGFVWNIPGVPTVTGKVPGPGDADDTAYLKAAIDDLAAQGCVDRSRVYVTGLSGGGRMASWLACAAADRFAAIAPVVGLRAGRPDEDDPARPDPRTCRPSRPVPVLAFAGDADTTNPVNGGGAGYWRYAMHAAEQRWAQLNGCNEVRPTRWITPDVYEEGYTACRSAADVLARITRGGGHSWVADNDAMWTFFAGRVRE